VVDPLVLHSLGDPGARWGESLSRSLNLLPEIVLYICIHLRRLLLQLHSLENHISIAILRLPEIHHESFSFSPDWNRLLQVSHLTHLSLINVLWVI